MGVNHANGFGSFAECSVIHVQCVIAVEMREGIDPVAQSLDDMMELWMRDDLAVGFEIGWSEEPNRYSLIVIRESLCKA
jgi:hypothetical protein